jgi:hypothetical protein
MTRCAQQAHTDIETMMDMFFDSVVLSIGILVLKNGTESHQFLQKETIFE